MKFCLLTHTFLPVANATEYLDIGLFIATTVSNCHNMVELQILLASALDAAVIVPDQDRFSYSYWNIAATAGIDLIDYTDKFLTESIKFINFLRPFFG